MKARAVKKQFFFFSVLLIVFTSFFLPETRQLFYELFLKKKREALKSSPFLDYALFQVRRQLVNKCINTGLLHH